MCVHNLCDSSNIQTTCDSNRHSFLSSINSIKKYISRNSEAILAEFLQKTYAAAFSRHISYIFFLFSLDRDRCDDIHSVDN